MWVLTHDGKNLINAGYFHVARNMGGRPEEKFVIQAFSEAEPQNSGFICSLYAEEADAVAELDMVLTAIEAGSPIYRFER